MIRIETDDFDAWKAQHDAHVESRLAHGIHDGPVYQDLALPGAALFHISVEDMERAMEWFQSDIFRQATRLAKVTGREFYLARRQER